MWKVRTVPRNSIEFKVRAAGSLHLLLSQFPINEISAESDLSDATTAKAAPQTESKVPIRSAGVSSDQNIVYEVALGENNNQQCSLYVGLNGNELMRAKSPSILSPSKYQKFRIVWGENFITLTKDRKLDPILYYVSSELNLRQIAYISYGSMLGDAKWKFTSAVDSEEDKESIELAKYSLTYYIQRPAIIGKPLTVTILGVNLPSKENSAVDRLKIINSSQPSTARPIIGTRIYENLCGSSVEKRAKVLFVKNPHCSLAICYDPGIGRFLRVPPDERCTVVFSVATEKPAEVHAPPPLQQQPFCSTVFPAPIIGDFENSLNPNQSRLSDSMDDVIFRLYTQSQMRNRIWAEKVNKMLSAPLTGRKLRQTSSAHIRSTFNRLGGDDKRQVEKGNQANSLDGNQRPYSAAARLTSSS